MARLYLLYTGQSLMSSFVWMKVLESAPERYDRGIRMLSGGRIEEVYERIAALVAAPGKRILDIGCGTGGVSLACAAHGATVTGIDINAGMLEVARHKHGPASSRVEFLELGAAEIEDRFAAESFDVVVSCLAMSEMSPDEQDYALHVAYSRLVPGGALVIADETLPENAPGISVAAAADRRGGVCAHPDHDAARPRPLPTGASGRVSRGGGEANVVGQLPHDPCHQGDAMRLSDLPGYLRDRLLGLLPHRAPTGLLRIGKPDRDSPVLVTGNYTLTVRRVRMRCAVMMLGCWSPTARASMCGVPRAAATSPIMTSFR